MQIGQYLNKLMHIIRLISDIQQSKLFISILILLIIGLHPLPILQELQMGRQSFWPIMAWGMYRHSHDSKSSIQTVIRYTIAITSSGEELSIESIFTQQYGRLDFFNLFRPRSTADSNFVGLNYFGLSRLYLGPMWGGDAAAAQRLADRLNRAREARIVEFRLESEIYTVTGTGIVKEDNPVITYRVAN